MIQCNDVDNFTINTPYFPLRSDELFLTKRWLPIFPWIPMLEARLKPIFIMVKKSLYRKILQSLSSQMFKLTNDNFFPYTLTTFLLFPKICFFFRRANIGTRASTGTFTLISLIKQNLGGGQNFERRNVERLKFRNFKVANIKITKDEFFDSFLIVFFHSLDIIWILKIFNNFSICKILILQMVN